MKGVPWTKKAIAVLRRRYPDEPTAGIAADLGITVSACYQKARDLGLKKSAEYLASPAACRLRRDDKVGAAFRYLPGHVPANKGIKGWQAGRPAAGRRKPNSSPAIPRTPSCPSAATASTHPAPCSRRSAPPRAATASAGAACMNW